MKQIHNKQHFQFPKLEREIYSGDKLIETINYTGLCFSATNRIPYSVKHELKLNGNWDDILSECYLCALECHYSSFDAQKTYNFAQKRLYRFLVNLGWRKVWESNKTKWKHFETIVDFYIV